MLKIMKSRFIFCSLLLAVMATGLVTAKPAQALLITQTYIFIGPNDGSAVLRAKNMNPDRRAYRVRWEEVMMLQNGTRDVLDSLEAANAVANLMPASPYLYVAPRRMMVQPDDVQSIRIMLRRTQSLQDGEYRSYITFSPETLPKSEDLDQSLRSNTAGASIDFLTGIRIPVFFLHGNTTLDVSFRDVRFGVNENGRNVLYYTLIREGNRSALGDIEVNCNGAEGIRNISRVPVRVFTELSQRSSNFGYDPSRLEGCDQVTIGFMPHQQDPSYTGMPMGVQPINF